MSHHDDGVSLRQMLDHTREIASLVHGRIRSELDSDRVLSLALVQLCQIVGEAARRVSPARQQQHPEIPWAHIIALRNRLIHGYDAIDLEILWRILTADMPPLITALEAILSPIKP